jgi:signal recognition particle receptor subunit beta
MNRKGGSVWYSLVSEGATGFIFSVDSTVTIEVNNEILDISKSLEAVWFTERRKFSYKL